MTIQTLMLAVNDIGAVFLVFVLWNLVHVNREVKEPYAKTISCGYALLALSTIFIGIIRHIDEHAWVIEYVTPFSKLTLAFTLMMVWRRLYELKGLRVSQLRSRTTRNSS